MQPIQPIDVLKSRYAEIERQKEELEKDFQKLAALMRTDSVQSFYDNIWKIFKHYDWLDADESSFGLISRAFSNEGSEYWVDFSRFVMSVLQAEAPIPIHSQGTSQLLLRDKIVFGTKPLSDPLDLYVCKHCNRPIRHEAVVYHLAQTHGISEPSQAPTHRGESAASGELDSSASASEASAVNAVSRIGKGKTTTKAKAKVTKGPAKVKPAKAAITATTKPKANPKGKTITESTSASKNGNGNGKSGAKGVGAAKKMRSKPVTANGKAKAPQNQVQGQDRLVHSVDLTVGSSDQMRDSGSMSMSLDDVIEVPTPVKRGRGRPKGSVGSRKKRKVQMEQYITKGNINVVPDHTEHHVFEHPHVQPGPVQLQHTPYQSPKYISAELVHTPHQQQHAPTVSVSTETETVEGGSSLHHSEADAEVQGRVLRRAEMVSPSAAPLAQKQFHYKRRGGFLFTGNGGNLGLANAADSPSGPSLGGQMHMPLRRPRRVDSVVQTDDGDIR